MIQINTRRRQHSPGVEVGRNARQGGDAFAESCKVSRNELSEKVGEGRSRQTAQSEQRHRAEQHVMCWENLQSVGVVETW